MTRGFCEEFRRQKTRTLCPEFPQLDFLRRLLSWQSSELHRVHFRSCHHRVASRSPPLSGKIVEEILSVCVWRYREAVYATRVEWRRWRPESLVVRAQLNLTEVSAGATRCKRWHVQERNWAWGNSGSEFQSRKDLAPGILETRVLNFLSPDICHHSLKLSCHNERGFSDREVKSSTTESFGALEVGIFRTWTHTPLFFPSLHICVFMFVSLKGFVCVFISSCKFSFVLVTRSCRSDLLWLY